MNRLVAINPARLNTAALAIQRRAASNTAAKTTADLSSRLAGITEPLMYYGRVAVEFGRLVAHHGKITLPNPGQLAEAQQGFTNFFTAFQNGAWKKVTVSEAGSLAAAGVTVYGFFLVGEMIGRGSVIGYQIPGLDLL
ncbi:hypothetical protein HDU76_006472 [Blyttiomyces sp. JEL0837]|nr:hypothetical protein HDU76_006472 [Blyttiomyces sp. JEL0837]